MLTSSEFISILLTIILIIARLVTLRIFDPQSKLKSHELLKDKWKIKSPPYLPFIEC